MFALLFIFTTILVSPFFSQALTTEQCYDAAENEFNKALPDPPKFSVPDEFENVKDLINQIKIIYSEIGNTNDLRKELNQIKDKLTESDEQLNMMKTGSELLERVGASAEYLEKLKQFNHEVGDSCSKSKEKYEKIKKEIEDIDKNKPKIDEAIEKLKQRVEEINGKSLELKNHLDHLHIPDQLYSRYLCDSGLFETFKGMIKLAQNIKAELEKLRDNLRSKLKNIQEKLQPINLPEEIPEMPLTNSQLKAEKKFYKERLKEAKKLKNLIEKKQKAEQDFNDIKNIAMELCRNDVCIIQTSVEVEQ